MCNGRKFIPKIQKIFVEIDKFFELEKAGITKDDNSWPSKKTTYTKSSRFRGLFKFKIASTTEFSRAYRDGCRT